MKGSLEEPSRKALKLVPSSWLTTLTIKKYDFCLDKQSFWDSLYIRYNIPLKRIPLFCVRGAAFKLEHALLCPEGGYMSIRHNRSYRLHS